MENFKCQNPKTPPKCNKKRLTNGQIKLLETSFSFNKKLNQDLKYQLAQELNLPPRQVAIWYQNKRARWKNQTLEFDHRALQLRLDEALANNKRLEREVEKLRVELEKAQKMLMSSPNMPYSASTFSSVSNCDHEDGIISKGGFETQFYACLVGVGDHDQIGFQRLDAYGSTFGDPSIS